MIAPKIISARFSCIVPKPKPKLGDRKLIKGVWHERQYEKVHDNHGNPIGYNFTGGRHHYIWVPINETTD